MILEKNQLNNGDIFIANPSLVGVYCFLCHPNNDFELIKNSIYTIQPNKICIYTGDIWEGAWNWSFSGKRKMLFIKIIYEGNLFWTNLDWLQKLI